MENENTDRRNLHVCITIALEVLLFTPISTWSGEASDSLKRIQERVEQLARSFPGTVGVFAHHIETGAEIEVNADRPFPMASVYKIPIMVHTFREIDADRLSLGERIEIGENDRRLGSGLFTHMTPGLKPTLYDLMLFMIVVSDNEATDLILDRVKPANVTASMQEMGLKDIRVDRPTADIIRDFLTYGDASFRGKSSAEILASPALKFFSRPTEELERASRAFIEDLRDVSTPRAMTQLLVKIFRSEAAGKESCEKMLEILRRQQLRGRIPRYLPEDAEVADKTGTIGYTTNDAGIIYADGQHIALTIFTLKANQQVTTGEAEARIGEIARAIYEYFHYQPSLRE